MIRSLANIRTSTGVDQYFANEQYFYAVAAVNNSGEGPSSGATTHPAFIAPAPTGFMLTRGAATVTLDWNAVDGATSYRIYRGTAEINVSDFMVDPLPTENTYIDTDFTIAGEVRFYQVAAVINGMTGARSAIINGSPRGPISP